MVACHFSYTVVLKLNLFFQVLEQVSKDILLYRNTGVGILEISHRSEAYLDIYDNLMKDVRTVL